MPPRGISSFLSFFVFLNAGQKTVFIPGFSGRRRSFAGTPSSGRSRRTRPP